MPHFKCIACEAGFYSAATPTDLNDNLCLECGAPLVAEPTEAVGVPSIARPQVADRVGHLIARREVVRAQRRFDAERRLGDGGSVPAETAARPGR